MPNIWLMTIIVFLGVISILLFNIYVARDDSYFEENFRVSGLCNLKLENLRAECANHCNALRNVTNVQVTESFAADFCSRSDSLDPYCYEWIKNSSRVLDFNGAIYAPKVFCFEVYGCKAGGLELNWEYCKRHLREGT